MNERLAAFWNLPAAVLLQELQTSPQGLTSLEAQQRLVRYGFNRIKTQSRTDPLTLFVAQFKSPIILILLLAAALSFFLHDPTDAFIIAAIVFLSGCLGFWQERGATFAGARGGAHAPASAGNHYDQPFAKSWMRSLTTLCANG